MKRMYILLLIGFPLFLMAYPKYEIRGAWVATVANIDWPSKKGLDTKTQQDEMIAILDSFWRKRRDSNSCYDVTRKAS